ncbi:MAG: hypothetical protein Ct9H300mP12_16310 [Acidimicrobiales bacterium]|nr:MAG: hypothetical protein Ct9H300mP12_16310 [Acidimicrobiales bacterium]
MDRALELVDAGDLRLACHLAEMAVAAEPTQKGLSGLGPSLLAPSGRRAVPNVQGRVRGGGSESEAALGGEVDGDAMRDTIRGALG